MAGPTIKDVAREAGVSIATVSYVLNNKNASISATTRQLVLETAARIGYRPNATARNLRSARTRLIGYGWNTDQPALDPLAGVLGRSLEVSGYHLLPFSAGNNPHTTNAYDELIRTGRVDAFVLQDTHADDPRIRFLLERKFPFVCYGRSNPKWDFHWIDVDSHTGVQNAVEYLVRNGHEQIAMLGWQTGSLTGAFQINGYREGLRLAGISFRPEYLVEVEDTVDGGAAALNQLWLQPLDKRPTAVITASDTIALGVLRAARDLGVTIGTELSLIGYGDLTFAEHLCPPLTTIRPPTEQIGETLTYVLDDMLNKQESDLSGQLFMPDIVERGSVAPVMVYR